MYTYIYIYIYMYIVIDVVGLVKLNGIMKLALTVY